MTTTATKEAKAKAVVTTKLMADGKMKTIACKSIQNHLITAGNDCEVLALFPHLTEKARAALAAIDALLDECAEIE